MKIVPCGQDARVPSPSTTRLLFRISSNTPLDSRLSGGLSSKKMEILPQLIVNALIAGSLYALVSFGLSLNYGLLRILHFAHGHFLMVGAYFFYLSWREWNQGLGFSLLFSLIVITLLSVVTLRVFVMPFLRFSVFLVFITTMALGVILESAISIYFGVNVKSLHRGALMESFNLWGVYITPIQLLIIFVSLSLLGLAAWLLHSSPIGRRINAIRQHTHAAQGLGLSVSRISYCVFILGSVLATISGIFIGFETNLTPTMGATYTIKAFAVMILGGLGNLWGTVLGAYLLALVENLSIGLSFWGYSLPAGYKDAFAFLTILLVLLLKPAGLFSRSNRAV